MNAPDATRCPMCGNVNRCAMEVERESGEQQPPCWCMKVDFSAALIASVPEPLRGVACLCEACARRSIG